MKYKTNKTQNTLIVITFLIACFFMGQWLWDNIPRYETQERIEFCKGEYKDCINEECTRYYSHTCSHWARYKLENAVFCQYDESDVALRNNATCYIKEKVRIN